MCSVCQSTAMLLPERGKENLQTVLIIVYDRNFHCKVE